GPAQGRQDDLAGMGPGAGIATAAVQRNRPLRARPRAILHHVGQRRRLRTGGGAGHDQARGRTGGCRGVPETRGRMAVNEPVTEDRQTRCGFGAIIGAPNAGKSTLLNHLVGSKVSIVTHKAQTTRARLRAIAIEGDSQLIFVDTPGIFPPRRMLDEAMVEAAWASAAEADVVLMLVDARRGLDEEAERIIAGLERAGISAHLVLNKIDLVDRPMLLETTRRLNDRFGFVRTFMVSALTGDGVDDLRTFLAEEVPPGPWLFPEDQIADVPLRQLAAEITREKLYL